MTPFFCVLFRLDMFATIDNTNRPSCFRSNNKRATCRIGAIRWPSAQEPVAEAAEAA